MTMTSDAVPTVVQQHDIPETIRALGAMASADYVDLFAVTASNATEKSAERWARVALEGVSPTASFIIWQVLCGLRLERGPSPDYVAGWRIADRGDNWMRLEAASWFMTCRAVVQIEEDGVSIALFVRYDHPIGAVLWPLLSIGHRRAMPGLLRHGVRRMERISADVPRTR